jgi:hypothetical protein
LYCSTFTAAVTVRSFVMKAIRLYCSTFTAAVEFRRRTLNANQRRRRVHERYVGEQRESRNVREVQALSPRAVRLRAARIKKGRRRHQASRRLAKMAVLEDRGESLVAPCLASTSAQSFQNSPVCESTCSQRMVATSCAAS